MRLVWPLRDQSDGDALRLRVQELVRVRFGPGAIVGRVIRDRLPSRSLHPADIVTAHLHGGVEFKVFVRYFDGPSGKVSGVAEREHRVYCDLLRTTQLGTAAYEGALWDDARRRRWLFLEDVDGVLIAYRGFEYWTAAARWLARLHAHFVPRRDQITRSDFLITHDASFFRLTAQRAISAVVRLSPPLGDRLADLLSHYGRCIDVMVSEPVTLVHGSFDHRHILIDDREQPPRICPVDWKSAAAGSKLYDLAFLARGLDGSPLTQLLDAYAREASIHDVPLPAWPRTLEIVDCLRLHGILTLLASASEHRLSVERTATILESVQRLTDRVCTP